MKHEISRRPGMAVSPLPVPTEAPADGKETAHFVRPSCCPKCGAPLWGEGWNPATGDRFFSHVKAEDEARCCKEISVPGPLAQESEGKVELPECDFIDSDYYFPVNQAFRSLREDAPLLSRQRQLRAALASTAEYKRKLAESEREIERMKAELEGWYGACSIRAIHGEREIDKPRNCDR